MNLYIDNHRFHYEMENLARAFFCYEKIVVHHEWEQLEQPYILTSLHENVCVTLKADAYEKTLEEERGEDDELIMARLLYFLLSEFLQKQLPWGLLTGVRPIKLFSVLERERTDQEAKRYFTDRLLVSEEKTALAARVSAAQKPILSLSRRNSFSLYVSIPFCPTRCSYCSFVSQTVERAQRLIGDYVELLKKEIAATGAIARDLGLRCESVYIGGGTPTTLDEHQLADLIEAIRNSVDLTACTEFTVEAGRPDTVTKEKLLALKDGGVTRISINPQTFNDSVLEVIGRKHTAQDTIDAFYLARELGFSDINMDFIAGLPSESPESFAHSIETALELDPECITVHTLALKRSSRLVDDDTKPDFSKTEKMLDFAKEKLLSCGYEPYYLYRQSRMLSNLENIGWAKQGFFSKYNIFIMEETHSILACGAGAVTKLRDVDSNYIERIFNFKYPYEYISRFDEMLKRKEAIVSFYDTYNR